MEKIYFALLLSVNLIILACGNANSNSSSGINESSIEETEAWEDCQNCSGSGYFIHKCSTCDGSGRLVASYTHTQTRTCPSCYGTGIAPCNDCGNYGYHRCSQCDGLSGKVRCSACNGAGRLAHNLGGEIIFTECGLCNGSGYTTCGNCGGKGRITCSSCWGEGHLRCQTCNGTGGPDLQYSEKTDQGECPTCGGTGKTRETCEECGGEGRIKVEDN